MDTREFLTKVLATKGVYALFTIADGRPRHIYRDTIKETAKIARWLDRSKEQTVYFALATFKEIRKKGGRTHDNAAYAKSFWLDIDCGEGKDYPDKKAGAKALMQFVKQTGLPLPMIVSSGNGLHVYWPLTSDIPAATWTKAATLLKAITNHFKFNADPARTADISSVLRPIGTHHRKNGMKEVKLLRDADETDTKEFVLLLNTVANKHNIKAKAKPTQRKELTDDFNKALGVQVEYKPSDADAVAQQCAQVHEFKSTGGCLPEPQWYAAMGVVSKCIDGQATCHDWSKGYDGYSESETTRKIEQLSKVNPTTCQHFESIAPELCTFCQYRGKITSPIQLGIKLEKAETPVDDKGEDLPDVPEGFKRAADGLYKIDEDGIPVRFFEYDLYPTRIIYDDHHQYEEIILAYYKPIEGRKEFRVRTASLFDMKKLTEALCDNGVIVNTIESRKAMSEYISKYVKQLQQQAATLHLYTNMGWKDNATKFVLGNRVISEEGISEIGLSHIVSDEIADGFHVTGSLEEWTRISEYLDTPGMEAHAFALCVGFGAPLMYFTGLEAALVNMVGASGTGKSTMQRWINSIYGNPRKLSQSHEDTDNAKFFRAALLGNLPVTIDEVTNIEPERLSSFVYRITQGRDKARLTREGVSKNNTGEWNTLLISSSNESMLDKLALAKANPEAESMRVFEYWIPKTSHFDAWLGKEIAKTLRENYGLAATRYVTYLINHTDKIANDIDAMSSRIEQQLELQPQERYWSAVISCAIYGGMIASKLGLIKFDVKKLLSWAKEVVKLMRAAVCENMTESIDILAQYFVNNLDSKIVVDNTGRAANADLYFGREPNRELHIRDDIADGAVYIDRAHFHKFVHNRGADVTSVKKELEEQGILITQRRFYIGKGVMKTSPQIWCLVLDRNHPELSNTLRVVGGSESNVKEFNNERNKST